MVVFLLLVLPPFWLEFREERENVDFLANQEAGVEEEESVEDDGGIAEVSDEVVQAKDIFQVPRGLHPPPPYVLMTLMT